MSSSIMQKVLAVGDLGKLSAEEKADYYQEVCRSLGLNPLTQPLLRSPHWDTLAHRGPVRA